MGPGQDPPPRTAGCACVYIVRRPDGYFYAGESLSACSASVPRRGVWQCLQANWQAGREAWGEFRLGECAGGPLLFMVMLSPPFPSHPTPPHPNPNPAPPQAGSTDDLRKRINNHRSRKPSSSSRVGGGPGIEVAYVALVGGEGGGSTARALERATIQALQREGFPLLSTTDARKRTAPRF